MSDCCKLFASLIVVLAAAAVIKAEENAVVVSAARIAELVKQLDDDDFALREAAVSELTKIGPAAAVPVAQAARGESLEAATRAFAVLDKWLEGDQGTRAAAREELGKLAQGPEASTATRRARALLAKPQSQTETEIPSTAFAPIFAPVPAVGLRVGVARVELRAMAALAGGAKGRSVSISIAGAKKTMNVVEGDFRVQIIEDASEDAKFGIAVTAITKDKEGKEKKTEYLAKNLEVLKKIQPEGFKLYEKCAGQMNKLKVKMDVGGAAQKVEKSPVKLGEPADPVDLK
jgi:hypothetical protein